MPFPSSVTGTSPRSGWHRLGAAVLMLGVSLLWGLLATPTHAASPTAAAASQPPHEPGVLIVAGNQHGLPVPEALINGAVSVLKAKGVSPSNIYVEHMDLDRFNQADTVAAWAALMHQKYANKRIGLVLAQDQASLEFLAHAGYDLLPPGQPVVATLIVKPEVTWRGAPHRILNVSELRDLAGTLRHGLDLFPQTRRLVLMAGVERTQTTLPAQLAQVLSTQQRPLDIEDTSALPYEAMLRRIASLPPDTLVLLSTYFQDSTGRNFIPAEEAAAVAKWADARAKSASSC